MSNEFDLKNRYDNTDLLMVKLDANDVWMGQLVTNVKSYGLIGDGLIDDYVTLNSILTSVGSTKADLFFPLGTYKISSDITVPSNVRLIFANGANISVDSGKTFTVNGFIEADLFQIFSGSGSIAGTPTCKYVYPEWFGAVADISTGSTPATNLKAIFNAGKLGKVKISHKYYIDGTTQYSISDFDFSLIGDGVDSELEITAGNPFLITGTSGKNVFIEKIKISTTNPTRIMFGLADGSYLNSFEYRYCEFNGYVRLINASHAITRNPAEEAERYGIKYLTGSYNKFYNVDCAFLAISNTPIDVHISEFNIMHNNATHIYQGVTNEHSYNANMTAANKLLIVRGNVLKNDRLFEPTTYGGYLCFTLFEGVRKEYVDNTVENLYLLSTNTELTDQYSNCTDALIYERNTIINTLHLNPNPTYQNELIKSKSSVNVFARYNKFKITEEFILAVGGNLEDGSTTLYNQNTAGTDLARNLVIENNDFDIYDLRLHSGLNHKLHNVSIKDNTFNCDYIRSSLLNYYIVDIDRYENTYIDIMRNTFNIRKPQCSAFRLLKMTDESNGSYRPNRINIKDNVIHGGNAALTYTLLGDYISVNNNEYNAVKDEAIACTFDETTDHITSVGHALATGDQILFGGSATPTGVAFDTSYYVMERILTGSKTYDPPSLLHSSTVTTTVTVTGVIDSGFTLTPSFSLSTQGIVLSSTVTAPNTVTVTFTNNTGSTINLASGTLTVVAILDKDRFRIATSSSLLTQVTWTTNGTNVTFSPAARDELYYTVTAKKQFQSMGNKVNTLKNVSYLPYLKIGESLLDIDNTVSGKQYNSANDVIFNAYDTSLTTKQVLIKVEFQAHDMQKDFEIRGVLGYEGGGTDRNYFKFASTDGTIQTIYFNRNDGSDSYITGHNTPVYIYSNSKYSDAKPTCLIKISTTSNTLSMGGLATTGDYTNVRCKVLVTEGTSQNLPIPDVTVTYDPPSLADAEGVTTTVSLTGATLGDLVVASFNKDLAGVTLSAYVSASNTVSVRFQNESGGIVDLASGSLKVALLKT